MDASIKIRVWRRKLATTPDAARKEVLKTCEMLLACHKQLDPTEIARAFSQMINGITCPEEYTEHGLPCL